MAHKKIEEEASYYLQQVGSIIYNRRENALNNCIKEAFIAGAEWAIQSHEYKPMLVEYKNETISGQPCELCPFNNITNANACSSLFEEHFGGKCSRFALRFAYNSLAQL